LQGALDFVTTEVLLDWVLTCTSAVKHLIIDLRRVTTLNESSCLLFHQLVLSLQKAGTTVMFTEAGRFPLLRRIMRAKLKDQFDQCFRAFEVNDEAMEWCENQMLDEALPDRTKDPVVPPTDYDLFKGLSAEQFSVIEQFLHQKEFSKGEVVVHAGDSADHLYLVRRGTASVIIDSANGSRKRLASFSAGMGFGEMAILDGSPRSATVIAETELVCHLLPVEDFESLAETSPAIRIKLLQNIGISLSDKLRRTNRELSVFQ
jgi:glutaminase